MTRFLYLLVAYISKAHSYIIKLNTKFNYNFTDKELHFIVIGLLGIALIFVIYPIFKYLAKRDHILTITAIYVFTVIVVITFAIEIGQKITNTGNMEFNDILFGVTGFIAMYTILALVVGIFKGIKFCLTEFTKKEIDSDDKD